MRFSFLTAAIISTSLIGQLPQGAPNKASDKKGKPRMSFTDWKINQLEKEVAYMKAMNATEQIAEIHVDSDKLSFMRCKSGLSFPIRLQQTQEMPGVGVKYIFEIINIYSVSFTNFKISLQAYYGEANTSTKEPLGESKSNDFLGILMSGSSCTISFIISDQDKPKDIQLLLLNISDPAIQWRTN